MALGQMNIRLRRLERCRRCPHEGRRSDPPKKEDRLFLFFVKGELAERQKHYEPAEQFFRQALELDPPTP